MCFVAVVFYIREVVYAGMRAVCCICFVFIFHTCMNKHIDCQRKTEPPSDAWERCSGCFCFRFHAFALAGMNVHISYAGVSVCGKCVQQLPRDSESSCDRAGL